MCRVPSIRSFMRLSERRNVDLPQPDGPIRAITDRSGIVSEMSNSACLCRTRTTGPWRRNLACTPGWSIGSRPFRLRSEMMAE